MMDRFPVLSGAEAWSCIGQGENSRIGLLLVHGFTGNPCSMRPLGEALAKHGFTVEVPRLPGHGTHWRDMKKTRYSDWRAEVKRALERLLTRSERAVLVGLSMGGTLVLDVGAERTDAVAGIVAINPAIVDRRGLVAKLAPFLERLIPVAPAAAAGLVKNDAKKPGVDEKAYAYVVAAAGNSLLRELPRIRRDIAQISVPVLVAHSVEDHSVAPENSAALLKLLEGRDVTDLPLSNSYHLATLDNDAELLVDKITEFARRVAAKRA